MPTLRLSPISYVVLGTVDVLGEATPYDLKRAAAAGVLALQRAVSWDKNAVTR